MITTKHCPYLRRCLPRFCIQTYSTPSHTLPALTRPPKKHRFYHRYLVTIRIASTCLRETRSTCPIRRRSCWELYHSLREGGAGAGAGDTGGRARGEVHEAWWKRRCVFRVFQHSWWDVLLGSVGFSLTAEVRNDDHDDTTVNGTFRHFYTLKFVCDTYHRRTVTRSECEHSASLLGSFPAPGYVAYRPQVSGSGGCRGRGRNGHGVVDARSCVVPLSDGRLFTVSSVDVDGISHAYALQSA